MYTVSIIAVILSVTGIALGNRPSEYFPLLQSPSRPQVPTGPEITNAAQSNTKIRFPEDSEYYQQQEDERRRLHNGRPIGSSQPYVGLQNGQYAQHNPNSPNSRPGQVPQNPNLVKNKQDGQNALGVQHTMHETINRQEATTGAQVNYPGHNTANTNLISTSVTGFGLALMKILDENHAENSVVSPFSIALVLALLQQGTEGEAQLQINRALRLSPAQGREQFQAVVTAMKNRRSRNVLNIATRIFVANKIDIAPEYIDYAVQYFASNLVPTNFENGVLAAKQINEWVSASTSQNIPYLVSPDLFTGDTQLVLANAVYFKGLWNSTFHPQRTVNRPFTLRDGGTRMAAFMHHSGKFQAARDQRLGAEWLVMPFEDLQYSLILVLPSESSDVSSLLQRLRVEDLMGYMRSPQRDVIISIPKFKVRVDTDLVTPLNALGIRDIFTYKSGLVGLSTPRGDRPRVTGALHAAVLSIDEQGGSAAAATVLAVSTLSLDFDEEFLFRADRPFLALLWDSQLSLPLFVAKIEDPTLGS